MHSTSHAAPTYDSGHLMTRRIRWLVMFLLLGMCTQIPLFAQRPRDTVQGRAASELEAAGIGVTQASYIRTVRSGDIDPVRLFLDAGYQAELALVAAARQGHSEILKLLLERTDARSLLAATALGWARVRGKRESAHVLLDAGTRLESTTSYGETAIIRAAAQRRLAAIRALIQAGANVNAATNTGVTPLMLAARGGHLEAAHLLIEAGAGVNTRDMDGWTPIMLATESGAVEIVESLIEARADVNAVSTLGWTPLMWAAREGHHEVASALVDAGADVNVVSKSGQTALIRAAQRGHTDVVRLLIRSGADVTRKVHGMDARAWAAANGHSETAQVLQAAAH